MGEQHQEEIDFQITISIPQTETTGKGAKQLTLYAVVVEAVSSRSSKSWEWKKARRYNEFYGLYHQVGDS
jgi:hypothetical protein